MAFFIPLGIGYILGRSDGERYGRMRHLPTRPPKPVQIEFPFPHSFKPENNWLWSTISSVMVGLIGALVLAPIVGPLIMPAAASIAMVVLWLKMKGK